MFPTSRALAGVAGAILLSGAMATGGAAVEAPAPGRPINRSIATINATEQRHRAWLSLDLNRAQLQAQAVANAPDDSTLHRLDGLVVAVKDNIDTDWLPTTAGSSALRNRRPSKNATVVDRVLQAGGVIPGKTNMDTFARGVRTLSELGGQTRNALDPSKSPGGSSGGTAVAVALGAADVGIGTDTCGSLRYPAAYNGIYGLRPTPGLVSRSGLVPLSPTHDVVGPMARTPQDLAKLLDVLAGPDDDDPLTVTAAARRTVNSYADILVPADRKIRIGVLHDRGSYAAGRSGRAPLTLLAAAGFELVDVKLPALTLPNVINEEFAIVKPKVLSAADLSDVWHLQPLSTARTYQSKLSLLQKDSASLVNFMKDRRLDAIVYPTTPYGPADIGRPQPSANCSLSASTGTPALTLPHPDAPTPGIDILGAPFSEPTLLVIAEGYAVGNTRVQ